MQNANRINRLGMLSGLAVALALAAGIYVGSHGLKHFDRAVMGYAVGSVLAAFAVAYRFAVWVQRPPSRMYFVRGCQLLFKRTLGDHSDFAPWDRVRSGIIPRGVSPHPGPLPQGEGMPDPTRRQNAGVRFHETQRSILPLPRGEGRGEG
ncbi:MAG: hypothetical protein HYY23_04870, partial [Verrucomicrobia bacterium]|nr:hypothetical protein [Verrucomicrobiota bacterium]